MIKIHKYFLICILFKISLIFSQYIKPTPRYGHTSILIGSKLYFIGGFDDKRNPLADFFHLDLSNPLTAQSSLPFASINNNGLTPNALCTMVTINNKIYLFGGYMIDDSSLVYQYDINSGQWTKPSIARTSPVRRWRNGVIVYPSTKTIYYFGGSNNERVTFDDMWTFKTNNNQLSWEQITPNNVRSFQTYGFTSTLLTDGNILCIGGRINPDSYASMENITRYNINTNSWDVVQTKGSFPGKRGGHSAVLVPDGRIIVYGGRIITSASFPPSEDLAVLDTTKSPYEWVIPNQVLNKPIIRSSHTAYLYENFNYMIVAFGRLINDTLTSEVLLLDVSDKSIYKWISFESSADDHINVGLIIGAIIGCIALIGAAIFLGYKLCKKTDVGRIAGGNREV